MQTKIWRSLIIFSLLFLGVNVANAATISGHVKSGKLGIANSKVTLWSASNNTPVQIASTSSDANGQFTLKVDDNKVQPQNVYYLLAKGGHTKDKSDNPQLALLALIKAPLPKQITINELTTVASVWTAAQFINGDAIQGNNLGLSIAASNVPNFVNLSSGHFGSTILDALNGPQTSTLARFATLGNILSGCVRQITSASCKELFDATTLSQGKAPTDTLQAAQNIAKNSTFNVEQIFALQEAFHPRMKKPESFNLDIPYMPYLNYQPNSFALALRFAGGGLNAPGGIAIDGQGNVWSGNNFIPGSQASLIPTLLGSIGVTETSPSGQPLSPSPHGFTGGGIQGVAFGIAVDKNNNIWIGNFQGRSISLLDGATGKPMSPESGYNFGGKLGNMQGIAVSQSGDVYALDSSKSQLVRLPIDNPQEAVILCNKKDPKTGKNECGLDHPFHLAIDNEERVWITNADSSTVTRINTQGKLEPKVIPVGTSPKGIAVDSQGNVWLSNYLGITPPIGDPNERLKYLHGGYKESLKVAGSVSRLNSDGTAAQGSPYIIQDMHGPWGVAIDGNDNVWIAGFASKALFGLCGVQTKHCPQGSKTGDLISPKRGFISGGLQNVTAVEIDPAGNVWLANNWQIADMCFERKPPEQHSTHCGGNGLVVYYGLAKPVKTPMIGPPKSP